MTFKKIVEKHYKNRYLDGSLKKPLQQRAKITHHSLDPLRKKKPRRVQGGQITDNPFFSFCNFVFFFLVDSFPFPSCLSSSFFFFSFFPF